MSQVENEWSIQRVLAWATNDFKARGLPSPRLDAEVLLAHVLGVDRVRLIVESERVLLPSELGGFRTAIERRRRAEPVAYIVGHKEFYGLELQTDNRALVPRPDTEVLVETALQRTRARDLHGTCIDLCTGSGCVAIAFAKARPTWNVFACDLSLEALQLARSNVLRRGVAHTVVCLHGDLFEALQKRQRFELVTANPPYIPTADIPKLAADIRHHEPALALDGGEDGLEIVRRIVSLAPLFLVPGGVLALELGAGQFQAAAKEFARVGFEDIQPSKDYAGWDRVISGSWKANADSPLEAAVNRAVQ